MEGPEGYSAAPFLPAGGGLGALREAAGGCRGCPLFRNATQTVFGWPWLAAEVGLVGPEVIVTLGATAGKALLGPSFRVTKERGVPRPCPPLDGEEDGGKDAGGPADAVADCVPTIHPSAVLRADDEDREAMYQGFVEDLRVAARILG